MLVGRRLKYRVIIRGIRGGLRAMMLGEPVILHHRRFFEIGEKNAGWGHPMLGLSYDVRGFDNGTLTYVSCSLFHRSFTFCVARVTKCCLSEKTSGQDTPQGDTLS